MPELMQLRRRGADDYSSGVYLIGESAQRWSLYIITYKYIAVKYIASTTSLSIKVTCMTEEDGPQFTQ